MDWPGPLRKGVLIRRYKRFLADVEFSDGEVLTVHCPNTGAMTGCAEPGSRVWLSHSDNPKRKYAYSWQLVEQGGHLICIHSALANEVFADALQAGRSEILNGYQKWRREVRLDSGSRIDFMLSGEEKADCYIEVKAVTLHQGAGLGAFPDTVSQRATKHLAELRALLEQGYQAQLAFVVLHNGIDRVSAASDIDPVYARALADAERAGVAVKAYGVDVTTTHMQLARELRFAL